MEDVEVKFQGHWLTATTTEPPDKVFDLAGGGRGAIESTGAFGQPCVATHETGMRIYFGSKREEQPTVINFTGETCDSYFDWGVEFVGKLGAKVTRVDVAADVGPDSKARERLKRMVWEWKRGKVETMMHQSSHSLFKSDRPGEGWTAYFGGKSSAVQLRAYDKRGPLRLEVQYRPEDVMGVGLAATIRSRGVAGLWRGLAKGVVWPMAWYKQLLEGESVKRRADEEVETTFERAMGAAIQQYGMLFAMLGAFGGDLDDVSRQLPQLLRGDDGAKLLRWCDEAQALGYDAVKVEAAREEVKCRLKSKPVAD